MSMWTRPLVQEQLDDEPLGRVSTDARHIANTIKSSIERATWHFIFWIVAIPSIVGIVVVAFSHIGGRP